MLKCEILETLEKYGAGDRNRTYDPLITNAGITLT
jgi:hypothetical protein